MSLAVEKLCMLVPYNTATFGYRQQMLTALISHYTINEKIVYVGSTFVHHIILVWHYNYHNSLLPKTHRGLPLFLYNAVIHHLFT